MNLVHFRLTDTGPLVSLINANDPHHGRCQAQVRQFGPHPLLTTWPCFTEAMYLVGKIVSSLFCKSWEHPAFVAIG